MGKNKRNLNRYESIYANIPKHYKKVIALTLSISVFFIIICAVASYVIWPNTVCSTICESYAVPLSLSIIASAVFAFIYSSMSGLSEIESVATTLCNKINHSCPACIYRATDIQENQFKEDLLNGILNCERYYYYEGIDLHTASYCILRGLNKSRWKTFPETHFILTKMNLLRKEEGIQLLKSIISICYFLEENNLIINRPSCQIELQMYIHVLEHDSGFHIHLTDKYLWLSPFRGTHKYPTTYKYENSDSLDSYYNNFFNRMYSISNNPNINKVQLNTGNAYAKLWSVLGIREFVKLYRLEDEISECKSQKDKIHKLSNLSI